MTTEPTQELGTQAPLLSVRGLNVSARGQPRGRAGIVSDVDFDIARGEVFAVIGKVRLRKVHRRDGATAISSPPNSKSKARSCWRGATCGPCPRASDAP